MGEIKGPPFGVQKEYTPSRTPEEIRKAKAVLRQLEKERERGQRVLNKHGDR